MKDTNEEVVVNWEQQYEEDLQKALKENAQKMRAQRDYERYRINIDNVQKSFRHQNERFRNGAEWKNGNIVPKEVKDEKQEETPEL